MGCGISNFHELEDQDNDEGRKQTLKRIKTRWVYSEDSMEKKEEELCDEREDSLELSVSPSFREYCLDTYSGSSSSKKGDLFLDLDLDLLAA
ncbi:hypothetical protein SLA2020_303530 [Shorea laevis]